MSIIRTIPWTRYPDTPHALNKYSWQGQNLLFFNPLVNNSLKTLKDLAPLGTADGVSIGVRRETNTKAQAVVHNSVDTETSHTSFGSVGMGTAFGRTQQDFTLLVKCRGRTGSENKRNILIGDYNSSGNTESFVLETTTLDTFRYYIVQTDNNDPLVQTSANFYKDDTEYSIACTVEQTAVAGRATVELFINGTSIGTDEFSGLPGVTMRPGVQFGTGPGAYTAGILDWDGDIWDLRVYDGILTQEQINDYCVNPYEIFQPRTQIIPFSTAAAANAALLTHPHRHTNLGFG